MRVSSGDELLADVVVTATGFNLKIMGGAELTVDGEPVDLRQKMAYRALMFGGVPNFAFTIGYTNASWTLKANLVADYVCRLLAHLDATGLRRRPGAATRASPRAPFMDFTPGYVRRSRSGCPSRATGSRGGCARTTSTTSASIRRSPIDDGVLRFH